jgi:uncharacterized protein (DUF1330 family)
MAAYLYANLEISDRPGYEAYSREVRALIAAHGGRFLVSGGATAVLEGQGTPQRQVIVEFPDMAHLQDWYRSAENRRLIAIRQAAANGTLLAIEGV